MAQYAAERSPLISNALQDFIDIGAHLLSYIGNSLNSVEQNRPCLVQMFQLISKIWGGNQIP